MDDLELCYLPAREALTRFADRSLSPVELVDALARRTDAVGGAVNAFTVTHFERARDEARAAEQRWRDGTARPLEGVPVAIKDSCEVAGDLTTHGSKVYETHRPNRTHPGVARFQHICRESFLCFRNVGKCPNLFPFLNDPHFFGCLKPSALVLDCRRACVVAAAHAWSFVSSLSGPAIEDLLASCAKATSCSAATLARQRE